MAREIDADYLFVAKPILERLRANVPGIPPTDVVQIEDIGQADGGARSPLIYVLWEGDQIPPADDARALQGAAQQVHQLWTALLYVRNASQVDLAARNTSAGRLLSQIHFALAGHRPEGCVRPFARVQGRAAQYRTNSALYPLTFSISIHL